MKKLLIFLALTCVSLFAVAQNPIPMRYAVMTQIADSTTVPVADGIIYYNNQTDEFVFNEGGVPKRLGSGTLDPDLAAIAALSSTGILVRTGSDTWAQRTLQAGNSISVTNGDGASGNP